MNAIRLAIWVGLSCALGPHAIATSPGWEAFQSQYDQGQIAEATQELEAWVVRQRQSNQVSPEAYANLARLYWEQEQKPAAIQALLKSLTYRISPWIIAQDLGRLHQTQAGLGVEPSLAKSPSFWIYFLLHRNMIVLILALSLWALVFNLVLQRVGKRSQFVRRALIGVSVAGFLVSGVGYFNRQLSCPPAVLQHSEGGLVALTSEPDGASTTLVELPSGLVVNQCEVRSGYVRVAAPVAGWVKSGVVLGMEL